MAPKILLIFLIQSLILKVFASQIQPAVKHYILASPQTSTVSHQSVMPTAPKPTASLSSLASLASLLSSGVPTTVSAGVPTSIASLASLLTSDVPISVPSAVPTPTASFADIPTNIPAGMLTSLASLLTTVPSKTVAAPTPPEKPPSNGVDMELLNNLAIALQLMIVNNILSSPAPESPDIKSSPQDPEPIPTFPETFDPPLSYAPIQNDLPPTAVQYQPYQQYYQMPKANFVGSSAFGGSNPLMSTVPPPMPSRSGLTLMSPYEALSPSSPYMDPILSSPYGSVMTSKHDFQSPYASILGSENKDFFSMSSINDLF